MVGYYWNGEMLNPCKLCIFLISWRLSLALFWILLTDIFRAAVGHKACRTMVVAYVVKLLIFPPHVRTNSLQRSWAKLSHLSPLSILPLKDCSLRLGGLPFFKERIESMQTLEVAGLCYISYLISFNFPMTKIFFSRTYSSRLGRNWGRRV